MTATFESSYRDATVLPDAFILNAVACRSNLSFQDATASSLSGSEAKRAQPAANADPKPRPAPAKGAAARADPAKHGKPGPPA